MKKQLSEGMHEWAIDVDHATGSADPKDRPTIFYLEKIRDLIAHERRVDRGQITRYAIAQRLDITPNRLSHYYLHSGTMENKLAYQVAELLGEQPLRVIARVEAERANRAEDQKFWRRVARKVAMVVFAAGAASSGGFNNNAIANPSSAPSPIEETSAGGNTHCATNRRRKRLAGWSTWWAALASLAFA